MTRKQPQLELETMTGAAFELSSDLIWQGKFILLVTEEAILLGHWGFQCNFLT